MNEITHQFYKHVKKTTSKQFTNQLMSVIFLLQNSTSVFIRVNTSKDKMICYLKCLPIVPGNWIE